jgi:hypothetical protein
VGHRRTEVTVEREVVSVRLEPGSIYSSHCPHCLREVLMISAEAASVMTGATRRQIYRWLEENRFHFEESSAGEAFICAASIALFLKSLQPSLFSIQPA